MYKRGGENSFASMNKVSHFLFSESGDIGNFNAEEIFFQRFARELLFYRSRVLLMCGDEWWGVESATTEINNFISGARHYSSQRERGKGASLFLRDLDRKDDSCAIAHDFLRVPPFSSISSACLSYFSPSSLIPVGGLAPLSLSAVPPLFFLARRIQFLPLSCERTFNLPRLLPA